MFKYPILILALMLVLLISPQKVQAADTGDVVINEAMANAPSPEDKLEWVELYNNSVIAVNLNGWSFDGDSKIISNPLAIIPAEGFLILARNKDEFLKYYPDIDPAVPVIQTSFVFSNSSDTIVLKNSDGTYIEEFAWTTDAGDRLSWERVDSHKSSDDNWKVTLTQDGTPGAKNSVSDILPPSPVTLLSPTDNQNLTDLENIELSWENPNVQAVTFELIVSQNADLTDPIIDEPNLTDTDYLMEELAVGVYYWQVITTNGVDEVKSTIFTFNLTEPTYSDAILINELLPDPSGDETENEWIELFNPLSEAVNLKGWILEDIKGSIHQYKIAEDLVIAPGGYAVIYRQDSGITLNNDQDGVRLYWPSGKLLFETSIFAGGEEDWTWARKSSGVWAWTTKPTKAAANIFVAPPAEEKENVGGDDEPIILNTVPIKIPTGEFKQYEDKLVKVIGTVVETSGNTFYLDDGSGKAKIYIQDKTGIDKPEMHRGDIFEVIGIVNLYRNTWRILPRQPGDIKLIQAIKSATNTPSTKTASTAKKAATTAKKAASSSSTATTARSPTSATSKVAAVGDKNILGATNFKLPTPFWVQLMESFTGLATVFLILLVVKVMRIPRPKVIGGNFGNDYT